MALTCQHCQTELVAGARYCHHCGQCIAPGGTTRHARFLRVCIILGAITAVIAWGLLFIEVETVLGTGPILMALGICLIAGAIPLRFTRGWLLGLLQCAVVLLFVILVNTYHLGPREARLPFILMGVIYLWIALPLARAAYHAVPSQRDPSRCSQCGYLLFGLSEPRCPECGTPFDPATVTELPT